MSTGQPRVKRRLPSDRAARVIASGAAILLVFAGLASLDTATASSHIEYPTWNDVAAARASEAATKQEIAKLQALLQQLKSELAAAQADEQRKGEIFNKAQDAYDQQTVVASDLRSQADKAEAEATRAFATAAQLIAEIAKSGDQDLTAALLAKGGDAASLLYRLSMLDQLSNRSDSIYTNALILKNTASALSDQAKVAEAKLAELSAAAQAAYEEARLASERAADALAAQTAHQAQLEAQLSVLTEKREATEKDYQAGLVAQWGSGAAGEVSASGWARPVAGYISSPFGMRFHPVFKVWRLHNGVDVAGQGCGAPIFATHAGTVTYAGANGTLGNYIQIEHGDGTSSGYGHIIAGGILVRYGEEVSPGQQIARVGTTGASTGCHLHFIIRVGGQPIDPIPFLRNQGVRLG